MRTIKIMGGRRRFYHEDKYNGWKEEMKIYK